MHKHVMLALLWGGPPLDMWDICEVYLPGAIVGPVLLLFSRAACDHTARLPSDRRRPATLACRGHGVSVDLVMSSLVIQRATSSGYGAGNPRTMCWNPASMASAIESRVLPGWP